MVTKVAVANQKGGVGKTDLCVNLGACLAELGKKVLIVDVDPQANATDYLTKVKPKLSTSDLLLDDNVDVKDIILKTGIENLFLAPASPNLNAAQVQLVNDVGMQFKLKKKLKTDEYDYILIDTPPSLGLLTVNALTACDKALIPIQVHYFAMDGVAKLINTINTIQEEISPELAIGGVILTMYDKRANLSFEVERIVRETFKDKVFKTMIPINVKLAESPSHHKPITLYSKWSRGAKAYAKLAKEFLK